MQSHHEQWVRHFELKGYRDVAPLSAGMEGAVYRLGDSLIAKVWADKPVQELTILQKFYADLLRAGLPFATPEILTIEQVGGTAVTVESELPGRPLREFLAEAGTSVPPWAGACVLRVLTALAAINDSPSALGLPVLGGPGPFRSDASWPEALLRLLERRVAAFGDKLRAAVPDFDSMYANLVGSIATLPSVDNSVIHGDICGENILVDDDMNPLALLDWGFLSTTGDPAFDASIAAGIFNMYGPYARVMDDHLLHRFAAEFGYPESQLLAYRAVYAIATSNAYDPEGKDGHFAWCARALSRSDVRAAVGS